ncbi:Fc.00g047860.m01.CDS01 [Cosmosporella sp. VM-42]
MSKLGLPFLQTNSTGNATGPFPAGMMDSFLLTAGQASPLLQLILFIYRLLGAQFGLDPSILLTLLGFLWGLSKIVSQVYAYFSALTSRYLMCAMYIGEHDQIYSHLMKFFAQKESIANNRFLSAQTVWKSAWEEEEDLVNSLLLTEAGESDGEVKYLNFASQAARSSPRYIPAMGTTAFWHKGMYFRVNRKKESFMNTTGWSAMKDLEEIKISCFGRSIEPIKQLIADAKTMYYLDTRQKTSIYRPRVKEQRRDGSLWQQVARRPVRPMRTVVLESKEKHEILADINEYLHPATPRWYASRGIPLRRGYLFHGPPGTGKTSFSFALAGVFGIDIYVISLQDVNVSEEDLALLFTKLPRRCIVLLEDIDTAGLRRAPDAEVDEKGEKEDGDKLEDGKLTKKEKKEEKKKGKKDKKEELESESESDSESSEDEKPGKRSKKKQRKRGSKGRDGSGKTTNNILSVESISLSGLLNAIDGVASHEGRVLIMTTNKPESLDEALIRPGRVDLQVGFQNASQIQAGELFHRMYEASRAKQKGHHAITSKAEEQEAEKLAVLKRDEELGVTSEELKEISREFGQLIPEDTFSPAEIQGFLLKRKRSPRKALEDAEGWIAASLKQKELKSKIATVQ